MFDKNAFVFLIVVCIKFNLAQHFAFNELVRLYPEANDFFSSINSSSSLFKDLLMRKGTLFIPINSLIENTTHLSNETLLYYSSKIVYTHENFKELNFITSEAPGNLSLWIGKSNQDIYINEAKILQSLHIKFGKESQILYSIDRLLHPTIPSTHSEYLLNPDALKFAERSVFYNIPFQYRSIIFVRGIERNKTIELFKNPGQRTFFIPIDDEELVLRRFDSRVVNAHVIQNASVFFRDGTDLCPVISSNYNNPPGTVITFIHAEVNGSETLFVRTINLIGDSDHKEGIVEAKILKQNIPVKNGVVHLISRPIFTSKKNILKSLQWYHDSGLYSVGKFLELMSKYGGKDIEDLLTNSSDITLFVPNNKVIENIQSRLKNMNESKLTKFIRTHVVLDTISSNKIKEYSKLQEAPFLVQTAAPRIKLLFSSSSSSEVQKISYNLYVEGRGVNATIEQYDLLSKNGYIHVIDKFFGFPDQTMEEILAKHPLLSETYRLYKQCKPYFEKLGIKFQTIFAPIDQAWHKFHERRNSNNYLDRQSIKNKTDIYLLTRHTLIKKVVIHDIGETNTTQNVISFGNGKSLLDSTLPNSKDKSYTYIDCGLKGKIIRADILASNGVIHLIDSVIVENDDSIEELKASSNAETLFTTILLTLIQVILFTNIF